MIEFYKSIVANALNITKASVLKRMKRQRQMISHKNKLQ